MGKTGLAILLSLASSVCWAQNGDVYRRIVVDEQSRPIDYFIVIVSNLSDSTFVRGETCLDGRLEMPNTFSGRKSVRIQSLGYEDYFYVEDFSSPAAADTITMKTDVVLIDGVTVTGRVPAVTMSRGKAVLRVAGSVLRNLPEVTDILRRAPGMRVDQGGISVFGKGTPLIYIDGREATYAELLLLQPQQILTIEVDRNPSARYDASYFSVVRVRTDRGKGQTSGQIANHSYQGRRFANTTSAQLQIADKRWVNYFSYQYTDQAQHNYVNDTEAIHLPESPVADSIHSDNLNASQWHSVLYGSVLDITPRHRLSWQYNGAFSKGNTHSKQQERIHEQGALRNIDSDTHDNSHRSSHSANLQYRFTVDSVRTFEVTADYSRMTPRSRSNIARHFVGSGDEDIIAIRNRSTADVFSVKTEYGTPLFGLELLAGLRYGHIDSRTTSVYNDLNLTLLRNDNIAAYATLGKEYPKWGWSAGLRGEFTNDHVRTNDVPLRDGWKNNLFPSLAVYTSGLSKVVDLSLSYTSRIERPSVGRLNPAASYINSVVTGYGNPLLRSTISHNLEFGVTLWSDLSLSIGANYDIDPIIDAGELNEAGDAIVFKPINVARSRSYLVDATYNNTWGVFSLTLDSGVEFPHTMIPYLGETISVGRPSWYASVDVDLKLAKNTSLTGGFTYYGRSYFLMTVSEPSNNLTVGITQYLFDRRLQLSLYGNDLLRGSMSGWHDRFGFYETSQRSSYDTRRVRFSVRWLFNNHKNRYSERTHSEEYNRIN